METYFSYLSLIDSRNFFRRELVFLSLVLITLAYSALPIASSFFNIAAALLFNFLFSLRLSIFFLFIVREIARITKIITTILRIFIFNHSCLFYECSTIMQSAWSQIFGEGKSGNPTEKPGKPTEKPAMLVSKASHAYKKRKILTRSTFAPELTLMLTFHFTSKGFFSWGWHLW